MTQKSLHDFFKVRGPPPKIKVGKSSKAVIDNRKISTSPLKSSLLGTSKRKRFKSRTEFHEHQTEEKHEMNLEDSALSNIKEAFEANNPVDIDLNKIYDCSYKYEEDIEFKSLNSRINYDGKINPLYDKSAEALFKAIFVDVFLNPINCEFFNQNELKLIMSIFKLSVKSKIIITRLLKWKKPWYRIKDVNESLYNSNIEDFPLIEIMSHTGENGIFKVLDCNNNVTSILQLMNSRELQMLCKHFKRPHVLVKEKLIEQLLGIAKMSSSLFPGAKSPRHQLLSMLNTTCGPSIQLSDNAWNIIKRILILSYPIQSRFEDFNDVFWMITEVSMGKRNYPDYVVNYYPVFRNRQHVIDYAEAKSALNEVTVAMKFKNWETVERLSATAYDKLMLAGDLEKSFIINQNDLELPSHIRRFTASYVWSKILMLSIDSPKTNPNYAAFVKKFIKSFIDYDGVICASIGRCYNELSAIEMKYMKNFDKSARLIEKGLNEKHLSIVIEAELLERAKKLANKKTGITNNWKCSMEKLIQLKNEKFECLPKQNYIEAKKMPCDNEKIGKSVWLIDENEFKNTYAQVEMLAQSHYMKNGFSKGLHCEGSLPVTLCACAFWNEIYNISVPGAFICQYQNAPLDLWSSMFIENRQQQIQERLSLLNRLDIDDLCDTMHDYYVTYQKYSSLISSNLFPKSDDIKEVIRCLGAKKVIGLCLILLNDYYHMSAGFPDLIVWNPKTLTCKIVEVKGPGDTLSIKQKLWINRLTELGINTEVCYVKAK